MNQQFILANSKLQLRPFTIEDASSLLLLNADPLVLQYTGDVPFYNVNEATEFILQYKHYQIYGYGRWAVLESKSNIFLGWCGLKYSSDRKETDIGFRFNREYWGKGFATEAAKLCLEYGFSQLGLTRIVGRAHIGNIASHKVLKKIGMNQISSFREGSDQWLIFEKVIR